MKFKPLIPQLSSMDYGKSPQLREQSDCAEDHDNFT